LNYNRVINASKYHDKDYIQFLIGAQLSYSCLEATKVQPESNNRPAHDAITRLLHRKRPNGYDKDEVQYSAFKFHTRFLHLLNLYLVSQPHSI